MMDQITHEPASAASVETIFPRVIDNTMYSDWRSCPHRFWRRHLQGLTRGRTSVHLHFGACFASALEAGRLSWHDGNTDYVKDACETFISSWGNFEIPDSSTQSERNKSLGAGLLAVQGYFREWPLGSDDFPLHIIDGKPAVEFSGAAPIPGTRHPETGEPIIYCGRFDAIGSQGLTLLGLDDKTTSSLGEHWRNQWKLRSQFTGYVWLASQYGLKLDGFRIRGTAILKASTQFDWIDVPRPPWLVDRWLGTLQHDVMTMVRQYTSLKETESYGQLDSVLVPSSSHPFPQNFDHACSDFSGCEFLDLCTSRDPDTWLTEYQVDRWTPLERPQ